MLNQLLFTLFIIFIVWAVVNRQRSVSKQQVKTPSTAPTKKPLEKIMKRFSVPVILGLFLLPAMGGVLWFWIDSYKTVTVTIVSPLANQTEQYQVRKRDISTTELTTVNGLKIRLSTEERIMIAENE